MKKIFGFKIGTVVKYFILADLALLAGWGLIQPVFAVFILDRIEGATVLTLGIGAAIYWSVKSIIQIPIALFLDRTPGEKDDYIFIILGLTLAGLTALSFIFITKVWQFYLVEFVHSLAFAFYIPAWNGMFARHLDKDHQSLDFSLDSTLVGVASAITGLLSGFFVTWFGYNTIFVFGALFSFVSASIIFIMPQIVFPHRRHKGAIFRNHSPKAINR